MSARYLSARTVAEMLDIDESTVYRYGARGLLDSVLISPGVRRFTASSVQRLLNGEREKPTLASVTEIGGKR